jgi:anhydro-N-acetylmuramic acid kinase
MLRTIGLMSGTSLDGVDAAWVETDGEVVASLGPTLTTPYDGELRARLRDLLDRAPGLDERDASLVEPVRRLTETHDPARRRTWQIGDAALLARLTSVAVAHDFRSADVAAGGQGAPLAPLFHAALARDLEKPLAVLNIGGVANVTWIGPGQRLVAFDTGPGNGPLDDWVSRHGGGPFDRDGVLARAGTADPAVLRRLLPHAYFARPAPKSLDRLEFAQALTESGIETLSPADGAATLVAFTAAAVASAALPAPPRRWLVCGGGRRNPAIMDALRQLLPAPVVPVEEVGWDGDALEAQCFGFLAARVAARLPLSLPQTTGVPRPMSGGTIVRPS